MLNLLVGGWQINGITTFQSGQPLLMNNAPTNTIGFNSGSGSTTTAIPHLLPADQRTQNRWFDTSVFRPAVLYHFGNTGRYSPDFAAQHQYLERVVVQERDPTRTIPIRNFARNTTT